MPRRSVRNKPAAKSDRTFYYGDEVTTSFRSLFSPWHFLVLTSKKSSFPKFAIEDSYHDGDDEGDDSDEDPTFEADNAEEYRGSDDDEIEDEEEEEDDLFPR